MKNTTLITITVVVMVVITVGVYFQSFRLVSSDDESGARTGERSTAPELTNTPGKAPRQVESEPISMMDLSGMAIGETFSLYIPQEERIITGQVERTRVSKAGNRVLQGRIRDGDRYFSFVVTVGRHQTFGSIQTRRDRYQFELTAGEGELIAQSTLNEKRDFSEPDFVIPERKEPEKVNEN